MRANVLWILISLAFLMIGIVFSRQEAVPAGMVLVNGGSFMMGTNDDKTDLLPIHTVTLDSFYIGKFEVSQGEWKEVMGNNPSYFKGDNLPVEQVSWYDAVAYCNKRSEKEGLTSCYTGEGDNITCDFSANGYRLLTEAEWEYAALGGTQSRNYKYSGSNNVEEVAWYEENSRGKSYPGGRKKANELGICDMSGNIWEWCWDWYDREYYKKSPAKNPRGPGSPGKYKARTYRGGGFSGIEYYMTVRHRDGLQGEYEHSDMGFRVGRTTGDTGQTSEPPQGMVLVKGGTFQMGTNDGFWGIRPAHRVTVNSFYMGQYEVTQEQWVEIMGYNAATFAGAMNPIDCVSWYDAVEYCNRRSKKEGLTPCYSGRGDDIVCDFSDNGYRLPTEAEWEYASRGGNRSKNYKYSGSNDPGEVAWYKKNLRDNRTRHIGTRKPNELGIYDMTGNAAEWCWDRYEHSYYLRSPSDNPLGPSSGIRRIVRGGNMLLSAYPTVFRFRAKPFHGFLGYGIRVVRTVK